MKFRHGKGLLDNLVNSLANSVFFQKAIKHKIFFFHNFVQFQMPIKQQGNPHLRIT